MSNVLFFQERENYMKRKTSIRTQSIHGKFKTTAWQFDKHLIPPMTASTTFRLQSLERGAKGFIDFADGTSSEQSILIYDRLEEPTTLMLEEQLATLENAECAVSFGSGMGAISAALLATTKTGDTVLAHRTLYGCTYSLLSQWLPRLGINTHFMNLNDLEDFKKQIAHKSVKVIYYESVSNPSLEIIETPELVKLVQQENKKRTKENKIALIVDNTFATPWGFRPLDWGVDFVVQSLTKNLSGFGTEMGGAIMTQKKYKTHLKMIRKDFGGIINPYSAWHILIYGLSTQTMRFEHQQKNALMIAKFLEKHPKVEQVIYPGLPSHPQFKLAKKLLRTPEGQFAPGFMISFRLKGTEKTCARFVDDLAKNSYAITLAVSLGLNKTLIEVPGFMTHSAIPTKKQKETNLDPRDIRLSVGLEDCDDLIHDLNTALKKL